MKSQVKSPKFYCMLGADLLLFMAAFVAAHLLRFDFQLGPGFTKQVELVLPILLPAQLITYYLFDLYRGIWRYTSIDDFWRLLQAGLFSSFLTAMIILYAYGFKGYTYPATGFSRSVFLMDGILTFLFTGGFRLAIRTFYTAQNSARGVDAFCVPFLRANRRGSARIIIIGAGGAGEKLLREIFDNPNLHYRVVAFLDDDPAKHGRSLHGIPILGPVDLLPRIVVERDAQEVIICTPAASGEQMRRIARVCENCAIPFRTLPALGEILSGNVSIKALRDVSYEDLLRRPPAQIDDAGVREYLSGRRVLVTGCGGSIGSQLCRQIVAFNPKELILIDAGEANLYDIQMRLHDDYSCRSFQSILGRVQDEPLMEEVFGRYQPHVVFHAAAYKHVPILERNPWEAIFNNVLGSRVAMEMAQKYGAERFVLVSTDKAVRPTNVMGTSKRLTELVLQSLQGPGTRFMAVRFGNVVGSSGSVIPLFRHQIEQGGPVTVTHPEVTRYFMTIPEAAQLILQAGALGEGGEIFVLEMGTPVRIAQMAEDFIRLSGKRPYQDIDIVFSGLREGEKLYEELITAGEDIAGTAHDKIMVLRSNGAWNRRGFDSQARFQQWLDRQLKDLYDIAKTHDACAIKSKLKEIVPEYTSQETDCVLTSNTGQPISTKSRGGRKLLRNAG